MQVKFATTMLIQHGCLRKPSTECVSAPNRHLLRVRFEKTDDSALCTLCDQFFDHMTVNVSEAKIASGVAEGEFLVVEAK